MVDIPDSVRRDMELVFVKRIQEALELTLESVPVVVAGPDSGTPEGPTARA